MVALNKRYSEWIVLAVAIVVMLPAVFCGLDVCDAGFYLTFYDNIFSAPDSVEYNFMYYLSGLVGSVLQLLVPGGGMLWMRICGALMVAASLWIVVASYRNLVDFKVIAITTLAIIVAYTQWPLTLSYDIVSLLLVSGGVALILRSLKTDSGMPIFASGLLLGMAIFARIPNVLFFVLILLPALHATLNGRRRLKLSLIFICGYSVGIGIVMGLMVATGDLAIFLTNLKTLASVGADSEASHGLGQLIMAQVNYYVLAVKVMVKLILMALWCMALACGMVRKRAIRLVLYLPAGLYFCYITLRTPPTVLLCGAVLPGLIFLSLKRFGGNITDMARAALLVALLFPCGSDSGGSNVGPILYLWGAPAAFVAWLRSRVQIRQKPFYLSRQFVYGAVAAFIAVSLNRIYNGGLYFDDTPIHKIEASIENDRARGIYTSGERAEIINQFLPTLKNYVSPGDTLFAYGSIPLLNYLTHTRPYVGCSWPEQLSAATLRARLDNETVLPVVCVQRFATIGSEWGTPSEEFVAAAEPASANVYHSSQKSKVISEFLRTNKYVKIEGTPYFDLYLPPSKIEIK